MANYLKVLENQEDCTGSFIRCTFHKLQVMKLCLRLMILWIALLANTEIFAQAGILKNDPNKSAALDLNATNKGLLIPQLRLTSTTDGSIVSGGAPATGLLVYNTNNVNTGGLSGSGFYFWSNNKWNKLLVTDEITADSAWTVSGNSGTNTSINFVGTTNAQDFQIKTNNQSRVAINASSGNVGIGITTPNGSAILDVNSNNKAVLLPRVALTDATDITTVPNPQQGMMVFNTNTNVFNTYDGARWVAPATAASDIVTPKLVGVAVNSQNQVVTAGGASILFDNHTLDPENAFSEPNGYTIYRVKRAGIHQIFVNLSLTGITPGKSWYLRIKKNGAAFAAVDVTAAVSTSFANVLAIDNCVVGDAFSVDIGGTSSITGYSGGSTRVSIFRFE